MPAHPADECRANALHCAEVAQHARTLDDRSNFLAFADTWYKLANEIDYSDRLVAFIDGLGVKDPTQANTKAEEINSGIRSLKRLTAAISCRFLFLYSRSTCGGKFWQLRQRLSAPRYSIRGSPTIIDRCLTDGRTRRPKPERSCTPHQRGPKGSSSAGQIVTRGFITYLWV